MEKRVSSKISPSQNLAGRPTWPVIWPFWAMAIAKFALISSTETAITFLYIDQSLKFKKCWCPCNKRIWNMTMK